MADPGTPKKLSPAEAADLAIEVILDRKGQEVLQLDISKCSDLADCMVICSARSARQVQAIAHHLTEKLKHAGVRRLSAAGLEVGSWVVLDYGDLFIHVMLDEARRFYDLEALWADGVVVRREAGESARVAGGLVPPASTGTSDD
jgi:ribosome-associated protein